MRFEKGYFNVGYLDSLSYGDSYLHRLDARVKILVSLVFIVCVVSFPKYAVPQLLTFSFYPVFLFVAADIPLRPILARVALLSPFIVMIGVVNPLVDREVILRVGGVGVAGGWVSFASILIKFALTTSTAFLLIATTSFVGICEGLGRLRVPDVFVCQLLFLYRYLFVLLEEAFRMMRAREARSFGKRGYEVRPFISLVSVLLVRTVGKAERIYGAMVARGFSGRMSFRRTGRLRVGDVVFLAGMAAVLLVLRYVDLPEALGSLFAGVGA